MNVIEVIGDRRYYCQQRNEEDFSTNLADYSTYFQGNIREKLQLSVTYGISTIVEANADRLIEAINTGGGSIILKNTTISWGITEGFVVGNTIRVFANGNQVNGVITAILGNQMFVNAPMFFSTLGVFSGVLRSDYIVVNTTIPTSLVFKFGLIPNTFLANSYNSVLDGQEQAYASNTITASYSNLTNVCTNSANLGLVRAKYNSTNANGYTFYFSVQHEFRVPHYISEWLTNYVSNTIPSVFAGTNSWRYTSYLNFGNNTANPNDGKVFLDDYQLGSVGFANQNFNSGIVPYSLESATIYEVAGVVTDEVEATVTTDITAQVSKLIGSFSSTDRAILYHTRFPTIDEYSLNSNSYNNNFMLDQVVNIQAGAPLSGSIIKNFEFLLNVDPSIIDINFALTYSDLNQSDFTEGDRILLQIGVEKNGTTAELSDRTLVTIGLVTITRDTDIDGLITNFQPAFSNPASIGTFTGGIVWNNRALECNFSFNLSKNLSYELILLTKLSSIIRAVNTVTGDRFTLDNYNFPLAGVLFISIGGATYQIINIEANRVLSVPTSDDLRDVQLTAVAPASYQPIQAFTGKVGFIFPWRQWIANPDVNLGFYDFTEEQNNRNFRTSNYSDISDWQIYATLAATIRTLKDGVFIDTIYNLNSNIFEVADFDEDMTADNWVQISTKYYNEDDVEIAAINLGGITRVEIIMESDNAGTLSAQSISAEIVNETTNNTGRHYRLHSDLNWAEPINPLQPLDGQFGVKVTITVISNQVKLECNVDGSKMASQDQNFYGHLYFKS